jgi:hypothetical protein
MLRVPAFEETFVEQAGGLAARRAPRADEIRLVRTWFERFEFKYWCSEATAARIETFASPYMRADRFASAGPQRNTSLYLDSYGYRFYEMHKNFAPDRLKLRVRTYGEPFGPVAFCEIKRKVKTMTFKQRAGIPLGRVKDVLGGRVDVRECARADRDVLRTFVRFQAVYRASAKVFVTCMRAASESRTPGEETRMTLDRDLAWQPARHGQLEPERRAWRNIPDPDGRLVLGQRRVLLELKFTGAPPRWMVELVSAFQLERHAFSKYTGAVEALRGR